MIKHTSKYIRLRFTEQNMTTWEWRMGPIRSKYYPETLNILVILHHTNARHYNNTKTITFYPIKERSVRRASAHRLIVRIRMAFGQPASLALRVHTSHITVRVFLIKIIVSRNVYIIICHPRNGRVACARARAPRRLAGRRKRAPRQSRRMNYTAFYASICRFRCAHAAMSRSAYVM